MVLCWTRVWRPLAGGVALMLLIPITHAQDAASPIDRAFAAYEHARVSLHVEQTRTSPLQADPVRLSKDAEVLRNGDQWGFQLASPIPDDPGVSRRWNAVYREGSAVAVNSLLKNRNPLISRDSFSATFYSPAIAGGTEAQAQHDRMWPTDGNLDLPCFGVLDGVPILGPRGFLAAPTVETAPDGHRVIRSDSQFGQIVIQTDATGAVPRTIEITQLPEHLTHGRRIAEIEMGAGNVWPAGKLLKIHRVVTLDADPSVDNGAPVYRGWQTVCDTFCEQGTIVHEVIDAKILSQESPPGPQSGDYWFGLQLPRHSTVQVAGASHLSYCWDGTWPRPNAEALANSHQRSKSQRAKYLLVGNLLLLVLLAGGVWWRTRTAPRS